jgi:hypothetical protein
VCVLLYYDISKHCACPLNKFIYSLKVVKLFLKHSVCVFYNTRGLYKGLMLAILRYGYSSCILAGRDGSIYECGKKTAPINGNEICI